MLAKVNLAEAFASFDEHWSPRIVGDVNEMQIQVVKAKAEFVWHRHDEGAEAFLICKGSLTVRLRDGDVHLDPGELIVIPPGTEHMPVAADECELLLFEPKATRNTGNVASDRTVRVPARIGPHP